MKKTLSVLFILLSILVLTLIGCVHTCDNVCPECNKCLDSECSDKVCADKCEGHEVAHSHTLSEVPEVKATCTKSGTKGYYVCSGCDKLFADAEGKTEIEAPEAIEKIAHSFTNYVSNNDATCTEDGTKTAKCDNCDATDTKADEGSKKDHSFTSYVSDNNATCIADGTKTAKCDNCDVTDKIADEGSKKGHSFTNYVPNNDATCTEDGTVIAKCDNCDATHERTVEGSKKGHSYGAVSYSWSDDKSTCTATRVCANDANHVETETVNSTSETTPATCTADGKTVYTASFTNSAFETQTTESVIEAKNHSYGAVSYSWSDDKSTCTATRVCANDANHVETETVNSTSETTPATCTADGKTVYTASFTNSAFETQTTESVIEAKNHSYGAVSYSWSDDKSTCTATRVCANDANHVETETVNSTSETTPATCTATGKTVYTANFTNDAFETQTEETILGMIEHTPGDAVKENIDNATCAKDGSYDLVVYCSVENCKQEISRETITVKATGEHVYATEKEKLDATCTVDGYVIMACGCGETEKTTISATGHKYESKVTAPTCTEAGFTTYTCSACDDSYTADAVDALGHKYEAVVTAPTCTEAGFTTYTCSACSDSYTADAVDALGHKYEAVVTAPTCTEAGFTTYTCSACGDSYTADQVDALGHSWTGYELTTAPTYESTGLLGGTCANCDAPTYELPVVSAENGYTALITGVLTRWQYTYNDFTFTVDLTNTDAVTNTYSTTNGTPWYVGFDASGAMVKLDGYKTTNASWDGTNLSFGGSGMTYYTTVTAPKATTVTLIINCARNKAKPFFTAGTEHCIDNLTVNGSSENVICFTDAQLSVTGWHSYTDYAIATLFLKEGDNVISFKSATTVNFKGIGYVSTEALHIHTDVIDNAVAATCFASGLTQGVHCSECNEVIIAQETIPTNGDHTFETYSMITTPDYTSEGKLVKKCTLCGVADEESVVVMPKVSEENGYVKVSSTDTEEKWQYTYAEQTFDIVISTTFGFVAFVNDPFIAENGGSISGTVSVSNDVPRYQNTRGQTFTATITVSSDTVADFIIKVENGSKTNTYAGLFSSITLDGTAVTINDGSVTGQGWGRSIDIVVASLNLTKGTHVITFTRTTDGASKNNFNIWGIGFITSDSVSITLGSEE